jgi:hypothetical protein
MVRLGGVVDVESCRVTWLVWDELLETTAEGVLSLRLILVGSLAE